MLHWETTDYDSARSDRFNPNQTIRASLFAASRGVILLRQQKLRLLLPREQTYYNFPKPHRNGIPTHTHNHSHLSASAGLHLIPVMSHLEDRIT